MDKIVDEFLSQTNCIVPSGTVCGASREEAFQFFFHSVLYVSSIYGVYSDWVFLFYSGGQPRIIFLYYLS